MAEGGPAFLAAFGAAITMLVAPGITAGMLVDMRHQRRSARAPDRRGRLRLAPHAAATADLGRCLREAGRAGIDVRTRKAAILYASGHGKRGADAAVAG